MSKFRFEYIRTMKDKLTFDLETDTVHKDRHELNLETYELSEQFIKNGTESWDSWEKRITSSPLYVKDSLIDGPQEDNTNESRWIFSDLEPDVK